MYIYDKQTLQRNRSYHGRAATTDPHASPVYRSGMLPRLRSMAIRTDQSGGWGYLHRLPAVWAYALPWVLTWIIVAALALWSLTRPPSASGATPFTISATPITSQVAMVRWGEPDITPSYWVLRSTNSTLLRIGDGSARSVQLDREAWHIGLPITICAYQQVDTAPLGVVTQCWAAQPSWVALPFIVR